MNNRKDILEAAIKHTTGDRDVEYGSPRKNLSDYAALVDSYLRGKYYNSVTGDYIMTITSEDIAWIMVLGKMARTFSGSTKADTYEDAAAYAAIAGECAQ